MKTSLKVASKYGPSYAEQIGAFCAKDPEPHDPLWDKYSPQAISLNATDELTKMTPICHLYASTLRIALSLMDSPNAPCSPLPAAHQPTNTNCRSTQPQYPAVIGGIEFENALRNAFIVTVPTDKGPIVVNVTPGPGFSAVQNLSSKTVKITK